MKIVKDDQGDLIMVPTNVEKTLLTEEALGAKSSLADALGQMSRISMILQDTEISQKADQARDHIRKAINITEQIPREIQALEVDG